VYAQTQQATETTEADAIAKLAHPRQLRTACLIEQTTATGSGNARIIATARVPRGGRLRRQIQLTKMPRAQAPSFRAGLARRPDVSQLSM
jgi:hypothetical protein